MKPKETVTFNYQTHDELPTILRDYMEDVVNIEKDLEEINIKEINNFLTFVHSEGEIGLPDEELTTVDYSNSLDPQWFLHLSFNFHE